ncbi:MAG: 3-phosphoshikimate 1-carboxyvinyltransferase [Streptosporangiales bacterium]|nr:3-phosphoshikimate 1-carboxyvinyltransferase [Streptosporangiales bacterium]MBO0890489.1 3-phosphoshikimate 1-carboxyvinyltransferase [Acidothermales bacterium]
MTAWLAPTADAPVRATVTLPGSKSVTNRALVLAALAERPTTVRRALRARDTTLMAAGLRALGVGVEDSGPDWHVAPAPLHGGAVDCGLSGTVMRFLLAAAPLADGVVRFDGDAAARVRPLGDLAGALRALGADISGDRLPLTVAANGALPGGDVTLDASASSQFVSALLLAGCRYDKGVTVDHVGPPLPSAPYVEMTLRMLADAGIAAERIGAHSWRVEPGRPHGGDVVVEPDLVNAIPFLAAALLTGGEVCAADWPERPLQAGDGMLAVLEALGGGTEATPAGRVVRGGDGVHGADLDLHDVSELVPTVAVLACFAEGATRVRGVGHIRGHETDRLAALATTLNDLGGRVTETADGLSIEPAPLHGGVFPTYGDHRLATAGALVGLRVPGVELDDVTVTTKTLPDFPVLWLGMLGL